MNDRSSDEERFESLYRSTYPNVVAYCRRRLGPSQFEDAVSEIYLIAWNKRDQFVGADSPQAWLYGVGFRTISSRYRATRRYKLLAERAAHQTPQQAPSPETRAVARDQIASAEAALQTLRPTDQELIRLAGYEGLSHKEIAQAMGIAEKSVRSRLYRARSRLTTAFENEQGGQR